MRKRLAWLFGLMLWNAWGLAPAATQIPHGLPEAFTAARHAIEAQGEEHIARNHRNEQRIAFRDGGIAVSALTSGPEEDPGWSWHMRLTGYGTPEEIQAVADPQHHIEGTRLEYRRGPITEWYENKPAGLEQGFTLTGPPAPGARDLVLVLALQGDLSAEWETPGQSVSFHTPAGDYALTYRDLKVIDAAGESIPARLALGPDRLEIHVGVRDAVWPIVVDPLVVNQQAKLTAADGAEYDDFGWSVALSGDTALVGAWQDDEKGEYSGSAYVFTRTGSTWSQQAKLSPDDGAERDAFGWSVALSGDTAMVAATDTNINVLRTGSVYVFTRRGSIWTQQAKLTADDADDADDADEHFSVSFGVSVALSGDTALVGAYLHESFHAARYGAAYVFTRTGSTWSQQAKLTAADGPAAEYDTFGSSVALSGDTALVGNPWDDDRGESSGSIYAFIRSGNTWSQQAKLIPDDGDAKDWFGWSVALSGNTALAGAPNDDDIRYSGGAAYVFTRTGSTWSQQAKLTAENGAEHQSFGNSVALSGDIALIGGAGATFFFTRTGSTWGQQAKLNDVYAWSVALAGDTALMGNPAANVNATNSGAAYVFKFGFGDILADVPGEYSGSVKIVLSNCSQSELNGTYFGALKISLGVHTGNTISGTAAGTFALDGEQETEYVQLSGTINESGKMTGKTTHTFLGTGGEGTFTGELTGNTLSIVNTGHDTYGETCSYTRYMSANRNSTTYIVNATAGTSGTVSPDSRIVSSSETAQFTVGSNNGYARSNTVTGTCPQGGWSGNTWTTGRINANCTVSFSFYPITPSPNCIEGYVEQPPHTGDCANRPPGSICLKYNDGYIWLIFPTDGIEGWGTKTCNKNPIAIAFTGNEEYHHILHTNYVRVVPPDLGTQRFNDVSTNYWAWPHVEALADAGITSGCGSNRYCPKNPVTRAQMSIFLLRGIYGGGYTPSAATGTVFNDVSRTYWAAPWIELFADEGITAGCGGGKYCPDYNVTRAEMAVFLLRSKHGSAYTPPATGTRFHDVPKTFWASSWIEQLAAEGITGGCGGGKYCPNDSVTRAQMAVFIAKTFNLPLPSP